MGSQIIRNMAEFIISATTPITSIRHFHVRTKNSFLQDKIYNFLFAVYLTNRLKPTSHVLTQNKMYEKECTFQTVLLLYLQKNARFIKFIVKINLAMYKCFKKQ